jgi:hypothetical protein
MSLAMSSHAREMIDDISPPSAPSLTSPVKWTVIGSGGTSTHRREEYYRSMRLLDVLKQGVGEAVGPWIPTAQ